MRALSLTSLLVALLSTTASAQLIDIDIDKTEWYENPIIWVGAFVVLILVLVLTRTRKA